MSSIRLCSFIPPPTLSPSVSSLLARHTRFRHEFIWQTVCRLCLFTAGSGAASARAPVFAFVIVISLLFFVSPSSLHPLSSSVGGMEERKGESCQPSVGSPPRPEPPPPRYLPQTPAPLLSAHPIPPPPRRGGALTPLPLPLWSH